MDALLSKYTEEQLISELGKGHYWFADGTFYDKDKKPNNKKTASVEYAVYFRFYN